MWLFIGPRLLAGIGQVTKRYATLTGGDFVEMGHRPPKEKYDTGFAFVLPFEDQLNLVDQYKVFCKKMIYMTICETETVHPLYGLLVDRYKTLYVASEFCQKVFHAFLETRMSSPWITTLYSSSGRGGGPATLRPLRS